MNLEIDHPPRRVWLNIWKTSEVSKRNIVKSLFKKYLLLVANKKYTASIDLKLFWKNKQKRIYFSNSYSLTHSKVK